MTLDRFAPVIFVEEDGSEVIVWMSGAEMHRTLAVFGTDAVDPAEVAGCDAPTVAEEARRG